MHEKIIFPLTDDITTNLLLSTPGVADWAQGEVTKLFSQISSNGKNNNNDMIMMTMKIIISRLQDPLLVSPLHQPGCGHQGVPSVTQVKSYF